MFLPLLVDRVVAENEYLSVAAAAGPLTALLVAAADGDREALAQLYDLTRVRVYSLVLRQVGPAAAEVVTKEVYVALWRQAPTFDPSAGHALAWIVSRMHHELTGMHPELTGMHHELTGEHRQLTGRHRVRPSWADRSRLSGRRPSEGCSGSATTRGSRSLTSQQQDILTLVYLGGYTHRQVAQLLGVPRPTVTATVRSGLGRLAAELPAAS